MWGSMIFITTFISFDLRGKLWSKISENVSQRELVEEVNQVEKFKKTNLFLNKRIFKKLLFSDGSYVDSTRNI